MMNKQTLADFQDTVWQYYRQHGRHDMLWRQAEPSGKFDPYKIMVSEVMLQQTQVSRVNIKFTEFLQRFPTLQTLAVAPLADVLATWSGLGYNRRAKFLWQAAKMIDTDFGGVFPSAVDKLTRLPGIGRGTAGAIATYAFNQPVTFIETNVRTVFLHHFIHDRTDVTDAEIAAYVEQTLDRENPREWYWALMDYGAFLKLTVGNLNKWSKSYVKQSKFQGSKRQLRGQILRLLADKSLNLKELQNQITDDRLTKVIEGLLAEQLISRQGQKYHLG